MRNVMVGAIVGSLFCSASCAMDKKQNKGAALGAGIGAAAGTAVGATAGGGKGALIGAAVGAASGGVAGALIGRYMDRQEAELRKELATAKIERRGDQLVVRFKDAILFDVDRAELRPEAKRELAELADVLAKYDRTNLIVEGHTDNTGSDPYNEELSLKRAAAVAGYLSGRQVEPERLSTRGLGEEKPIASNETVQGRQLNRRVMVLIQPNEELRRQAAAEERREERAKEQQRAYQEKAQRNTTR